MSIAVDLHYTNDLRIFSINSQSPSDMYGVMFILILSHFIIDCFVQTLDHFASSTSNFHFVVLFPFKFHRESPLQFRLVCRMECVCLIVYRLTMAFVQSARPILVTSAKCICGLLIYILVNLIPVDICHPTLHFVLCQSLCFIFQCIRFLESFWNSVVFAMMQIAHNRHVNKSHWISQMVWLICFLSIWIISGISI